MSSLLWRFWSQAVCRYLRLTPALHPLPTGSLLTSGSLTIRTSLALLAMAPEAAYGLQLVPSFSSNAVEIVDGPALLQYTAISTNGWVNLLCPTGTVMFWFSPSWDSGNGPGTYGRLLEVGEYTTNASIGWWSLYLDPWGTNIFFSGQTNGAGGTYLSAPIQWDAESWHFLALRYTPTNTDLFLDGEFVTNGAGVAYWPSLAAVQSSGFRIGGDDNGTNLANGLFEFLVTFDYPAEDYEIESFYELLAPPPESMMMGQGISFTGLEPSGSGSSQLLSLQGCGQSSLQLLTPKYEGTNVVLGFTGASGQVDLFYSSDLSTWSYFGRSGSGQTNFNFTPSADKTFFVLGTLQDSDGDTNTDAYERLVSHTDPYEGLVPLEVFLNRPSAFSILP